MAQLVARRIPVPKVACSSGLYKREFVLCNDNHLSGNRQIMLGTDDFFDYFSKLCPPQTIKKSIACYIFTGASKIFSRVEPRFELGTCRTLSDNHTN